MNEYHSSMYTYHLGYTYTESLFDEKNDSSSSQSSYLYWLSNKLIDINNSIQHR